MGFFFEEIDFNLFEILHFLPFDFTIGRVIDDESFLFIGTKKSLRVITDLG